MRDRHIQDTRIHCCLFFINPTGHSLRAIDIIVMKKLSEVVNVVPVIAKSDSLTFEEREAFKQKVCCCFAFMVTCMLIWIYHQIRAEMTYHNIRLYPFDTEENDDEEIQLNESIRVSCVPFPKEILRFL